MLRNRKFAPQFGFLTQAALALAIVVTATTTARAQYSWVNTNNQTGTWTATARWTGGPVGTFPNAVDATAVFNLPLSTAPSGNYNVQLGQGITVGGITVNNYSDGGVNDINALRFGANGTGSLTFQSSTGPAFYTENASSPTDSTGATNIFAATTFASNTVITQNHRLSNNNGTQFTSSNNSPGGVTAAPGITVTKEGLGNINFTVAPTGPGTGFQGSLVINAGGVRDEANVFANSAGITVNSGGQYQLGSSTITNWTLGTGSTLSLSGPGKAAGTVNPEGALRFNNNAATASFDNAVNLASTASVYVAANLAPTPPAPVTYGHLTLANVVSGEGGLTKEGPGILELTQANIYSGGTTVSAGTLLVNNTSGSATGNGPVTVDAGAALGGSGSIAGSVSFVGGSLAPGNSPGLITLGGAVFDSLSTLNYQLDVPNVVDPLVNDLTQVNGDLTLDGTLSITGLGGFGAGLYRLFNYTGQLTNNGLDIGSIPGGFQATVLTSNANEVDVLITQVPEPSTLALAAVGLTAVAVAARRKRRPGKAY